MSRKLLACHADLAGGGGLRGLGWLTGTTKTLLSERDHQMLMNSLPQTGYGS